MAYPVIVVPSLKVNGLTLYPFILVREPAMQNDPVLIRHEMIHICQQAEMLVIPFYLFYLVNYLVNRIKNRDHYRAYRQIIFEQEAYDYEADTCYLEKRIFWAWMRYLKRK